MMKKNIETYLADAAPCTRVTLVLGISVNRIFLILAEFGHSDRNGGILCKKRKNSAKIGMVGSYGNRSTAVSKEYIYISTQKLLKERNQLTSGMFSSMMSSIFFTTGPLRRVMKTSPFFKSTIVTEVHTKLQFPICLE